VSCIHIEQYFCLFFVSPSKCIFIHFLLFPFSYSVITYLHMIFLSSDLSYFFHSFFYASFLLPLLFFFTSFLLPPSSALSSSALSFSCYFFLQLFSLRSFPSSFLCKSSGLFCLLFFLNLQNPSFTVSFLASFLFLTFLSSGPFISPFLLFLFLI
jgi:hypothetical protein